MTQEQIKQLTDLQDNITKMEKLLWSINRGLTHD